MAGESEEKTRKMLTVFGNSTRACSVSLSVRSRQARFRRFWMSKYNKKLKVAALPQPFLSPHTAGQRFKPWIIDRLPDILPSFSVSAYKKGPSWVWSVALMCVLSVCVCCNNSGHYSPPDRGQLRVTGSKTIWLLWRFKMSKMFLSSQLPWLEICFRNQICSHQFITVHGILEAQLSIGSRTT